MRVNWQIINRRLIKDLHERMHAAAPSTPCTDKGVAFFFFFTKFNCKVTVGFTGYAVS